MLATVASMSLIAARSSRLTVVPFICLILALVAANLILFATCKSFISSSFLIFFFRHLSC